jgi:hypothetical protein
MGGKTVRIQQLILCGLSGALAQLSSRDIAAARCHSSKNSLNSLVLILLGCFYMLGSSYANS